MADPEFLQDLPALVSLDGDEVLYVVDDPTGTPTDASTTVADVAALAGAVAHPDLAAHQTLGLAAQADIDAEATTRGNADTALSGRLDTVEGDYLTSADAAGYATAAQGATADTAVQPGDNATTLGSGAATDGFVATSDGAGAIVWESVPVAGGAATVQAGTLAARPAASVGNTAALYFATDVAGGQMYRSNGSAWVSTGPSTDDIRFVQNVAVPLGTISTTAEIDFSMGRVFTATLGGNVTLNAVGKATGRTVALLVVQDGTGGRTITWPTITWATPGGTAPTINSGAGAATAIELVCFDGSTIVGYLK